MRIGSSIPFSIKAGGPISIECMFTKEHRQPIAGKRIPRVNAVYKFPGD
jgi:hypothetical protein